MSHWIKIQRISSIPSNHIYSSFPSLPFPYPNPSYHCHPWRWRCHGNRLLLLPSLRCPSYTSPASQPMSPFYHLSGGYRCRFPPPPNRSSLLPPPTFTVHRRPLTRSTGNATIAHHRSAAPPTSLYTWGSGEPNPNPGEPYP